MGLGKQMMDKRGAASGMADNENRIFDFNFPEPREKKMIHEKGCHCKQRVGHKKQYNACEKQKVPVEPE
jgi:hypothetical protein